MPWYFWILLAYALLYVAKQRDDDDGARPEFDAAAYDYQPSEEVLALLQGEDWVAVVTVIRDETGLNLGEGIDLYEFLLKNHA
ncbi:MAG: hypothetical protein OSB57_15345 [Planctomycetota bacterium]|nr:hypothetical protein [Planctomycetota bacterium]